MNGHEARRPVVVGHDEAWAAAGEALAEELRAALAPAALRVEHIGSTAIPGMAAKPVIDLQVSVADLSSAAAVFAGPLEERGFRRQPFEQDTVPPGSGGDPSEWRKRVWARRDHQGPDANLHVRLAGSPNERFALLFRDWFRSHPQAVPAYAAFKQALAEVTTDVGAYADVKDPVVALIVGVAEGWADASGWSPAPAPAMLVVDAMNVIGARPDGWWRDRDAAVRRLVARLGRYCQATGTAVLVAVDGRPLDDLPEGRHGGVDVRYARRGGRDAADDRIVELLEGGAGPVTVVTADRDLRERVTTLGARVLGPAELQRRLDASDA